jgi:hypothetical protein
VPRGSQEARLIVGKSGSSVSMATLPLENGIWLKSAHSAQRTVVPAVGRGEQRLVAPSLRRLDGAELKASQESGLTREEGHDKSTRSQTQEQRAVTGIVVTTPEPQIVMEDAIARGAFAEEGSCGAARPSHGIEHRVSPSHRRAVTGTTTAASRQLFVDLNGSRHHRIERKIAPRPHFAGKTQ